MTTLAAPNSADDPSRIKRVVDELCHQLGSRLPDVASVLSHIVDHLELDAGFAFMSSSANSKSSLQFRAGTTSDVDSVVSDILTSPAIVRAVEHDGGFYVGVAEDSELASDERRRLWTRDVRTLICVPLRTHTLDSGLLLFLSRRSCPRWDGSWASGLRRIAEAVAGTIDRRGRANPPATDSRPPSTSDGPAFFPRGRASSAEPRDEIVGDSAAWRYVMFRVDQVATTHATVLLLGETGTGKEVVAHAIHRRSPRARGRFVALNSAALPTTLFESELFGRERGAFTGAHSSQPGRFELAHRGTLFLDELGDFPLELQPKLLRVLQEGQLERLGGTRTIDVNVRVIAATNHDLAEDVRLGRFRQDLYYRLNVFPITLPSLRDRRDDIPALAWHFVERFGRPLEKRIDRIPDSVMQRLQSYDWPGNIRELENVMQRAIIVSTNGSLSLDDIALPAGGAAITIASGTSLIGVEREHILRVLELSSWRIDGSRGAADLLGMKPSTLRSRLRKLQVQRPAQVRCGRGVAS
jgi:transcriptional regulator with GAF, ATPase, and Fis domain